MRMTFNLTFLALAAALSGGCASVVNDARQDIRVQARLPDGQLIQDAQCTLRNERETLQTASDSTAQVRRSADDLHIQCQHPEHPEARARAISRSNKQMVGNAMFLFGVGAILDHKLGTGYTYPGWVQPVFGQELVFDRRDEKNGEPVPARGDSDLTKEVR